MKSWSEVYSENLNELLTLKKGLKENFSHIKFQEQNHQYFNGDKEYRSVSSILDQFVAPFDREGISFGVSKRDKVSVNEVKAKWDIRKDLSIVRGTEFHLYAEIFLNEGRKIETITPIQEEIESFHLFWDHRNQGKYEVVATELIVADDNFQIAGTIDCLVRHRETKNFFIFDWKTNRNIRQENLYRTKMKAPIDHLDDCELNKYSLQLGLYRFILKKNTPIDIKKNFLIHLCPEKLNEKKCNEKPYKVFEAKAMENELGAILESLQS